jgi:hypothetical protein
LVKVLQRTPRRLVVEARSGDATRLAVALACALHAASAPRWPWLAWLAPAPLFFLPRLWMRETYDFDLAADAFLITYLTPLGRRRVAGAISDVKYFTVERVYVPGDAHTEGYTRREFILKLRGDRFSGNFKSVKGTSVRLSADSWRPEEENERVVRMIMTFVKSGGDSALSRG